MSRKPPRALIQGVLSPFERTSEILFGLIMTLAMTGALSVVSASEQETRAMFFSALTCNVAWGVVDAVMYVLNALFERGRRLLLERALRTDQGATDAVELLADVLPERFLRSLSRVEVDALRHQILAMPDAPAAARVERDDLIGAVGVFLLVVAATFPVALPFLLVREPKLALMTSRVLSLGMLFAMGLAVGRYAGLRPVRLGLSMLGIGAILVGVVIALGG